MHIDELWCFPNIIEDWRCTGFNKYMPPHALWRLFNAACAFNYYSCYDEEQTLFLSDFILLENLSWSAAHFRHKKWRSRSSGSNKKIPCSFGVCNITEHTGTVCVLTAEPHIGCWWYWFTYCPGHSVSSIYTPASHEGDTATKILNSLLLILSRTKKKQL